MRKVRIKQSPVPGCSLGPNSNKFPIYYPGSEWTKPEVEVNSSLSAVPEDEANIEAEGGETALIPDSGGLPAHFDIVGKRHSEGGVPLKIPEDSFIFSDTRGMKLKGPVLEYFGKSANTKKSYTPAELAKKYDINNFRKMLQDPDSDYIQVRTAEAMIANYNRKLGALSLVQEAKKGFPTGIPIVALPFMASMGVEPDQLLPLKSPGAPMMKRGGPVSGNLSQNGPTGFGYTYGGNYPVAQWGENITAQQDATRTNPVYIPHDKKELYENAWNSIAQTMQQYSHPLDTDIPYWMIAASTAAPDAVKLAALGIKNLPRVPGLVKMIPSAIKKGVKQAQVWTAEQLAELSKIYPQLVPNTVAAAKFTGKRLAIPAAGTWYNYKHEDPIPNIDENIDLMRQVNLMQHPDTLYTKQSGGDLPKAKRGISKFIPGIGSGVGRITYGSTLGPDGSTIYFLSPDLDPKNIAWVTNKKVSPVAPSAAPPVISPVESQEAIPTTSSRRVKVSPPIGTIRPYGNDPDNLLAKSLKPPGHLRSSDVKKHQSVTSPGIYGDASYEDFKTNNPEYLKHFRATNKREFDLNKDVKTFQKDYNTFTHDLAYKRARAKNYPEDKAKLLADKFIEVNGFHEGKIPNDPRSTDDAFGEFTSSRFEPDFEEYSEDTTNTTNSSSLRQAKPVYNNAAPNAPWWLQDQIKTLGSVGDFARINKYLPWAPKIDPYIPETARFDPTRELASNAEQMAIGTQGAGVFSGPQQYMSRFSAIQGQGAKNAADILGRYANMNVQASNAASAQRADIMNKTNEFNAKNTVDLYDKTTIANQQYDNAKNQARQEMRQSYIDAITNRATAQSLNSMYPNYQIDPATGGLVNFYNGEPLDRNASSNDEADRIINMHRKLKAAGIEDPSKYINKSTIDANPYDDRDPNRSYKGRGTT